MVSEANQNKMHTRCCITTHSRAIKKQCKGTDKTNSTLTHWRELKLPVGEVVGGTEDGGV